MKAAVFKSEGVLSIEERPKPELRADTDRRREYGHSDRERPLATGLTASREHARHTWLDCDERTGDQDQDRDDD